MRALLLDQATMIVVAKGSDHRSFKILGDRTPGLEFILHTGEDNISVGKSFVAPNCHCLEDAPAHLVDKKLMDRMADLDGRLALLNKATRMRDDLKQFDLLSSAVEQQIKIYEEHVCMSPHASAVPPLAAYVDDFLSADCSMIKGDRYVPAR